MRKLIVGLSVMVALSAGSVYATNHTATMTGYAYGNEYNRSGVYIDQGDFANHSSMHCPGDPAAYWSFGTNISMVFPPVVPDRNGAGGSASRSVLTLEDIGDDTCDEPNYWADNYFGRNATADEWLASCPCSGSPYPGFCFSTSWSNCQDAVNWGAPSVTYAGP